MANPPNNPYDAQSGDGEYALMDPAYTAPDQTGPYADPGAPYADRLNPRIGGSPDPQRTQQEPTRSYWARSPRFWKRLDQDRARRESVTTVRGQIVELQDPAAAAGANRFAPNPRAVPPAGDRPMTQQLAPTTYGFTRPMTGGTPKRLNGFHFSMADHARMEPELFGVAPARSPRGTQRLDVLPVGRNVVDAAPRTEYPDAVYTSPASPAAGGSYRLGG